MLTKMDKVFLNKKLSSCSKVLRTHQGYGPGQLNLIEFFLQRGADSDVIYTKYGHDDLYTEIKDFINSCPSARNDDVEHDEESYQRPCSSGEREQARLLLNLFDSYLEPLPNSCTGRSCSFWWKSNDNIW